MPDPQHIFLVVPTLNAGTQWPSFLGALIENLADLGLPADHVLIIDSSSTDSTASLAAEKGCRVHTITRSEYDHGATRQLGAELLPAAELIVYLTQDAILAQPDSLRNLIHAFEDPEVGMAYGRQLPRPGASAREAFARLHNYPETSVVRSLDSRRTLGFKSVFASDSFACYRRSALVKVGGFPDRTLFGEDVIVTARMHLAGMKSAYVAEATVYHSHDYSLAHEFRRYFDVGTFHSREAWILDEFGGASGEGIKFVRKEIAQTAGRNPFKIAGVVCRTAIKLAGYRVGRLAWLPQELRKRLSMNRGFWAKEHD